jgi:hypothetical protein
MFVMAEILEYEMAAGTTYDDDLDEALAARCGCL